VRRFSKASLVVATCLVVACGAANPLPRHRDLDSYPAALLTATLVRSGDCLYADAPDGSDRWLPIWPRSYHLDGDALFDLDMRVATVGDTVPLGGGEYRAVDEDFLRSLMVNDIPTACRIGQYWLVNPSIP
jgi:hypothetical protein